MTSLPNRFFFNANVESQQLCVDGPWWQNNFGDGALNQYKGVSPRDKSVSSRYKSVFLPVPQFWIVLVVLLVSK